MAKALIIITSMPTPIIAIGRIPASAWSHAPRTHQTNKGWQAAMAGYRMAVLYGLWVDAAGLTLAWIANIPINLMGNRWETMIGLAITTK
jgi:hypothetical protein